MNTDEGRTPPPAPGPPDDTSTRNGPESVPTVAHTADTWRVRLAAALAARARHRQVRDEARAQLARARAAGLHNRYARGRGR